MGVYLESADIGGKILAVYTGDISNWLKWTTNE